MPNRFSGKGNLADAPTLKAVRINGEDRKVAEMRIFFDEYSRNADGDFEQDGGMWLGVSIWGQRAEAAARLLRRGARVSVEGQLKQFLYAVDGADEKVPGFQVLADDILLSMSRIESVNYTPKRQSEETAA